MSERKQKLLKNWEQIYPSFISIVIVIILHMTLKEELLSRIYSEKILSTSITLTGVLFGFLLTVLALLLQSDNKSIALMKDYNRFNELINYNKKAVYSAGLCFILSAIYLIIFDITFINKVSLFSLCLFKVIWLFVLCNTIFKTYRYIDIFYTLIKS